MVGGRWLVSFALLSFNDTTFLKLSLYQAKPPVSSQSISEGQRTAQTTAMPPLAPQSAHFGLLLPICTSSATVGLALYQYPQFYSFLNTEPSVAGKTLSRYWEPMYKTGGGLISVLSLSSTVAGALAARWLKTHKTLETTDVSHWYTYGTLLAAGHFVFFPLVAGPIKRMIDGGAAASSKSEEQTDRDNREEMKTWFLYHTIRTILVDLPALWCFAEGAAQSFWIANV